MTVGAAKTDLYTLLTSDQELGLPADELAGLVVRVFKGEPTPGVAPKPSAVTIFTESMTALDYLFRIRVYQDVLADAIAAQDALDATVEALTEMLDADARYGRSDWQLGWDPTVEALIAQTLVEVGREDF